MNGNNYAIKVLREKISIRSYVINEIIILSLLEPQCNQYIYIYIYIMPQKRFRINKLLFHKRKIFR